MSFRAAYAFYIICELVDWSTSWSTEKIQFLSTILKINFDFELEF